MQITSLLNILAASAAALPGKGAPALDMTTALSTGGTPNTGALTDALISTPTAPVTATPANPWAQFAELIQAQDTKTGKPAELPLEIPAPVKDIVQDALASAPAQTTPAPTALPIPLYIDQPIQKTATAPTQTDAQTAIDVNNNSNKKLIFQNPADSAPEQAPAAGEVPVNSKVLASEVYNKQETPTKGKIKLTGLDTTNKTVDPEFQKAFANIVEQAKTKAPAPQQLPEQQNTQTDTKGKIEATETLTQPQQVASKINAKVLGVKEDKIKLDTDISPEMTAKLQDLDAQLRTRSYTQIKAVAETLPQTPAEQVQVKISQAIASGENTIKINLHPAELGAVDVDLDTDKEGVTRIRILADKAETLQMLQHDSKHLVKSLAEIGVKADASNLQFSLRGDQQQQNFAQNQNNGNFNQPNLQQANAATTNYSRFSNINEQDLISSVHNQSLNILV